MSFASLPTGRARDAAGVEPSGELRWSWGLFGLMALAWSLVGLAFYVSSRTEGRATPWVSDAIWRVLANGLWFAFTPAIFFLAKAFPLSGEREARNAWVHAAAAVVFATSHMLIFLPAERWLDPYSQFRSMPLADIYQSQGVARLVTGSVNYAVVLFVFASIDHSRRARMQRFRAEELSRQLAEAQLSALRMQIQPHFLFNTLHSISALIHEAPSEALTMVSRLGDFLRASLDRGAVQTLRFADELKFVELYLDIERVRFGDRLRVTIEASPEALAADAPTLILQPLVENAIRHGVAPAIGAVDLKITAAVRDGRLEVSLSNVERQPVPGQCRTADGEGLGLANTRARLRHAYGEAASLEVDDAQPGAFQVTVRLPAEAAHADA